MDEDTFEQVFLAMWRGLSSRVLSILTLASRDQEIFDWIIGQFKTDIEKLQPIIERIKNNLYNLPKRAPSSTISTLELPVIRAICLDVFSIMSSIPLDQLKNKDNNYDLQGIANTLHKPIAILIDKINSNFKELVGLSRISEQAVLEALQQIHANKYTLPNSSNIISDIVDKYKVNPKQAFLKLNSIILNLGA